MLASLASPLWPNPCPRTSTGSRSGRSAWPSRDIWVHPTSHCRQSGSVRSLLHPHISHSLHRPPTTHTAHVAHAHAHTHIACTHPRSHHRIHSTATHHWVHSTSHLLEHASPQRGQGIGIEGRVAASCGVLYGTHVAKLSLTTKSPRVTGETGGAAISTRVGCSVSR